MKNLMKTSYASTIIASLILSACGGGNEQTSTQIKQAAPQAVKMKQGGSAPTVQASVTNYDIAGFRSSFTVTRNSDNTVTVTEIATGAVQNFPSSVMLLKFYDKYTSFDTTGIESQAYRLYQAAFNRKPDEPGLGFWIKYAQNGLDFQTISKSFIDSDEFIRTYGANSNNAFFVGTMYNNVLHRKGEDEGVKFWSQALVNGATRQSVLVGFSESAENQKALLPDLFNGYNYVPYQPTTPIAVGSCKPYDWQTNPEEFGLNDYSVKNNMWNRAVVPSSMTYTNCTQGISTSANGVAANWNWVLPAFDGVKITGAVKGFPEIEFGKNPGGIRQTTTKLPLQVANIGNMSVTYDMEVAKDDETDYRTFFDVYYMPTTKMEGVKDIAFNFALIVDHGKKSYVGNPNAYKETIIVDDVSYDVYVDKPSADVTNSAPYVIVVAKDSQMKATINIGKFTAFMVNKGWVKSTQYLTSVEFGTEVVAGTGSVTVKSYSIAM